MSIYLIDVKSPTISLFITFQIFYSVLFLNHINCSMIKISLIKAFLIRGTNRSVTQASHARKFLFFDNNL